MRKENALAHKQVQLIKAYTVRIYRQKSYNERVIYVSGVKPM